MKLKGVTPRQIQTLLNFPYVQTVYNWFLGKNMPSIDKLVVIAKILDIKIDELVVTTNIEVEVDNNYLY